MQGLKEGKASWKTRKQALDDVDAALKRCNGLLDVAGPKMNHLVSLLRALRDRLTDTQINLKPLAARVIGAMLSAVDKPTQAKLGRIAFTPLITAAMNDIKKPMRDAALGALKAGTTAASLDGGGVNNEALEEFIIALISEVNERSSRVSPAMFLSSNVMLFLYHHHHSLTRASNDNRQGAYQMCSSSSMVYLALSRTLTIYHRQGVSHLGKNMPHSLLNASRLQSLKRGQLLLCF